MISRCIGVYSPESYRCIGVYSLCSAGVGVYSLCPIFVLWKEGGGGGRGWCSLYLLHVELNQNITLKEEDNMKQEYTILYTVD